MFGSSPRMPYGARGNVLPVWAWARASASMYPLLVMQDKKLFEKHAKAAGLDTQANYMQLSGGNTVNDALLSGTIHIV